MVLELLKGGREGRREGGRERQMQVGGKGVQCHEGTVGQSEGTMSAAFTNPDATVGTYHIRQGHWPLRLDPIIRKVSEVKSTVHTEACGEVSVRRTEAQSTDNLQPDNLTGAESFSPLKKEVINDRGKTYKVNLWCEVEKHQVSVQTQFKNINGGAGT